MVRKPGFAPGPSASQAEMLLLHHNPVLNAEFRIQNAEWEKVEIADPAFPV